MPELTPIQSRVLADMLAGKPIAAVARENGIHRSTIYAWRRDQPVFILALDQARSRLSASLYDEVQDLVSQSLQVLGELLHSKDDNLRLRVAQTLLRAANPGRPSPALQTDIGTETLADKLAGSRAARYLTKDLASDPGFDPQGHPTNDESDTIRHFSTLETQPPNQNEDPEAETPVVARPRAGRNQPCPCKSGRKYKKCCGNPAAPPASTATLVTSSEAA